MDNLSRLIEIARQHEMTEKEKDEQVLSFAYGNTHLANPSITREGVEKAMTDLRLMGPQSHENISGSDCLGSGDQLGTPCVATAEAQRVLGSPVCGCGHDPHRAGKCAAKVGPDSEPEFLWVRCKCEEEGRKK